VRLWSYLTARRNEELLRRLRKRSSWICSLGSFGLLAGISTCYIARWDAVAALTLFPFWAWGIAGLGLSGAAWRLGGGRCPALLCLVWIAISFFLSDDLSNLVSLRRKGPTSNPTKCLRVVTLNCAGQVVAAEEIASCKPDIVLLQESPASNDVARLAKAWFGAEGSFLAGLDGSILARGHLTAAPGPKTVRFVRGTLGLGDGKEIEVVSLRLEPPETNFELWSPACWQAHTRNRQKRRDQLRQLLTEMEGAKAGRPCIVGGDFNAPAGDAIFRLLRGFLKDSFREAGAGWSNTALNSFPVVRVDQIWTDERTQAIGARVKKTQNSDHRMVICDLELQ